MNLHQAQQSTVLLCASKYAYFITIVVRMNIKHGTAFIGVC